LAVVKSEQFEAYFAKRPANVAMFLLHGPDSDLVSERARRLVPALVDDVGDPFQVVRLSADALVKDPGRLADEASAISMFGGKRVIWVDAGGRDFSALIGAAADLLPAETSLVVEADVLRQGAPMRVAFETRPNAVAIECYPPSASSLADTVEAEAKRAGVRISREVRDHLVAILAAEPGAARGEIAKLMLFAGDGGALETADVDALTGAGASPADALVDVALAGDLAALERAVGHGFADGVETRLAQRVALLLEIRQSGAEPERLYRLPPAVRRNALAQAHAFAPEALVRRLPALLNLLISARRDPALARSAAFRALLSFALQAQRRARETG
jgi:DNA polymerase-3 subunit delta